MGGMQRNQRILERPGCNSADPAEAQAFETEAVSKLKEAGLRVTSPRVRVIRALSRTNCALSAYEIHGLILDSGEAVDVVSVYRILQALMETGLVHRIGVLDGYYACRTGASHGEDMEHLVCRSCGCVQEMAVPRSSSKGLAEQVQSVGFRKEAVHVEVLGTCAHCLERQA